VSSNVFWTCRSCGADVPGELLACPRCVRSVKETNLHSSIPAWVRGVSIPGALFGMLAFFLPWIAVSCGPVRMTVSGYELATGQWSEKLSDRNIDSFYAKTNRQLNQELGLRQRVSTQRPSAANVPPSPQDQNIPLLWIVPGVCLILFVLAVVGMPRAPTIVLCALGAAYLAYFGVTSEQQLNDPGVTGGILGHEWLFGYWGSWVGLMVPMFVAIFQPPPVTGGTGTASR
jgi:hypothetical protein